LHDHALNSSKTPPTTTPADGWASEALGRIARLARRLIDTPIAWISDGSRVLAASGLAPAELTSASAVDELLHGYSHSAGVVVPDALREPRVSKLPLIERPPKLRFLAGIPLQREGRELGALWVASPIVHHGPTEEIAAVLTDLAALAADELELRRKELLAHRAAARVVETLESVTDAFYSLDHAWRFTYLNPQAEQLLRRSRQALVGKVLWEEFPEVEGSILEGEYRHAVTTMQSRHFEFYFAPLATTFEVRAYPSASGLSVYFQDINERKRRERETTLLLQTTHNVQQAQSFESALKVMLADIANATGWDYGEAWLLADDGETLVTGACYAPEASYAELLGCKKLQRHLPGVGMVRRTWEDREAVWVADIAQVSDKAILRRKKFLEAGLQTALAVPIVVEDKVLAVLYLLRREPTPRDARTLALIESVAVQLSWLLKDKQQQARLERSQRDFERLFKANPLPMWVFDSQALTFLEVNEAAVTAYGYTREEFLAMTLYDLRPESEREKLERYLREKPPPAHRSGEWLHRRKDGTTFWVKIDAHAIEYFDRSARLVVAQDISERKRAEDELRRREAHFRALIEKSFECVTLVDRDWRIVYQSPSTKRVMGYAPHEHVGEVREDLLHPDDRERFAALLRRLEATPGESARVRYRFRHKDGRWRWLEANVTNMLEEPSVEAFVINYRDVSEQVEAQEAIRKLNCELRRSAESYRALANFGATIEEINDVETLMTEGLQRLSRQLGLEVASAYRIVEDSCQLEQRWGEWPAEVDRLLQTPIRKGEGALGQAARDGTLVYVEDYQTYADGLAAFRELGLRTHLVLPVCVGHEVERLIALSSYQRPIKLGVEQLTIAANFVKRLENALERIEHLGEIAATREATFRALGLALEYRDYETKGHTDRVAELALHFGRALGLGTDTLQAVQWGAYLHDLGKVAISDAILLKPGKLSDEEFAIIKQHTLYGFEMCRDIPFLPVATRELVRSHHERFDGTGYPDALAGEAIPLAARLFSLVDVYDALTSERPYKRAWSHQEAVAEIRSQSGKQFDPALVEVFLEVLAEHPAQAPQ
jgi:PAS domain S-box-containing protein/putative nucleotidyltransferase with HDIG domain